MCQPYPGVVMVTPVISEPRQLYLFSNQFNFSPVSSWIHWQLDAVLLEAAHMRYLHVRYGWAALK